MSTAKTFGFVSIDNDDGSKNDIFIEKKYINTAMNGDMVTVKIIQPSNGTNKAEGKITKINERAVNEIVGIVEKSGKTVFVVPDDKRIKEDIFIPKGKANNAKDKSKVLVKIEKYPTATMSPEGKIVKILGKAGEKEAEIYSILEKYNIPYIFSKECNSEIKEIPNDISSENLNIRKDFRNQRIITIDGEDTKDVDDAIFVEKNDEGYTLYVHIADVSHYVKENSNLDKEAFKRSTSVYLIDTVIPMLPKQLSNGICSLNEGVDRLCMTCIMNIDNKGNVVNSEIVEGVINVRHHMTYKKVQAIIDGDEDLRTKYIDIFDDIKIMLELSRKIDEVRHEKGNIDFNTGESFIKLDEEGKPIDIKPYDRTEANRIIENFMIYANESVASEYFWRQIPFIYRVHEEPSEDKIEELKKILSNMKLKFHFGAKIYSGQLRKLIESVEGTEFESFINQVVLHSMMRARYDTAPLGHFGLGLQYYSHFTSPIRRYADLKIHRIIKETLNGKIDTEYYESILPEVCKVISANQKRADDCEREYDDYQMARYMAKRIGNTYKGTVDHITKFGIYVKLANTVEGMVRIKDIPFDNFTYVEEEGTVKSSDTGIQIKIGDRVKIKVIGASAKDRTIDFMLLGEEDDKANSK